MDAKNIRGDPSPGAICAESPYPCASDCEAVASKGLWPCAICAEDRPYFVICPACQADACTECYERVFTGLEFRCMHCRATMTRDFVIRQMGVDWFHKVYVPFMMDAVMKQEHEALPAAQDILETLDRAAELYPSDMAVGPRRDSVATWGPDYFGVMEDIMATLAPDTWATAATPGTRYLRVNLYDDLYTELRLERGVHAPTAEYNDYTYQRRTQPVTKAKDTKATRITGKCPADDCRGFLVANTCGLCATRVCPACRVVLGGDSHECRHEDIEAVALIARDTKPCPRCYAPISKVSGCDQMWCVCCQTTFSWNTGAIETGPVHNPHYWEWRRQHGIADDPPAAPGGACQDPQRRIIQTLNTLYRRFVDSGEVVGVESWVYEMEFMVRTYRHVQGVVISQYQNRLSRRFSSLCLRLRYLRGEIDDAQWRRTLQRRVMNDMRMRAMIELIETWLLTIADLLDQPVPTDPKAIPGFVRGVVTQYRAFLDYLNGLCDDLSTMYRFKVPVLVDLMPERPARPRTKPETPHPELADLETFPKAYKAWA